MKRAVYSLFPKFLQDCSLEQLAESVLEAGFDAVDLVVRDGYWVAPDSLAADAARFTEVMRRYGLRVEFATTGYTAEALLQDSTPLEKLAAAGIQAFRLGYFSYNDREDFFVQMDRARASLERVAEKCAKYGVKAVYQVHHGERMLISNPVAALYLVRGLSPELAGIMLDPGNQLREGSDNWRRAIFSLGPYLASIGVKDGRYRYKPEERDTPGKGWEPEFAPCQEGMSNWETIAGALDEIGFDGVLNFQPFYYTDQRERHLSTLKTEVAYIRRMMSKAAD